MSAQLNKSSYAWPSEMAWPSALGQASLLLDLEGFHRCSHGPRLHIARHQHEDAHMPQVSAAMMTNRCHAAPTAGGHAPKNYTGRMAVPALLAMPPQMLLAMSPKMQVEIVGYILGSLS